MRHPRWSHFVGTLIAISAAAHPVIAAGTVVQASAVGAKLDSHLMTGGGNDDTAVLQKVLDQAANGGSVHLIIDGAALVSGLDVYGNTTVECLDGGGLYLKDGSSRSIIRNAHRSKRAITDERITIRGCFLNGNRDKQPSADLPRPDLPGICCTPSNRDADGSFMTGLEFLGVNDLTIENISLWNIRAFGVLVANATRIAVKNLTVDYGGPDLPHDLASPERRRYFNTDGLMFKGPLRYAIVDGLKLRTGDAAIAMNADTWPEDQGNLYGPYVGVGPITDVSISNVQLMDSPYGIGFISAKERIDRVIISNVTGTIRGITIAGLGHWVNPNDLGNFGSIVFDNVNVYRPPIERLERADLKAAEVQPAAAAPAAGEWTREMALKALQSERDPDGVMSYFAVTAHVENLSLRNVIIKATDDSPILWFGPSARVQMLTADISLLDPTLQAVPVKLAQGSRIENMSFALRWSGNTSDQGKNAILSLGGFQ